MIQNHDAYSLILEPDKDRVLVVTTSAAFILDNCNGRNSIEDLERKTLRHFSLPIMKPIAEDVNDVLGNFEKEGIVDKVEYG